MVKRARAGCDWGVWVRPFRFVIAASGAAACAVCAFAPTAASAEEPKATIKGEIRASCER
jgi:hypothetical protein